mmetsp:Transcript_2541/g.4706  ORF Transcript_2541/g.4706 Transcript_2541/m.4706 type:complete len:395 (-) Transcript_2541:10-1194(-)
MSPPIPPVGASAPAGTVNACAAALSVMLREAFTQPSGEERPAPASAGRVAAGPPAWATVQQPASMTSVRMPPVVTATTATPMWAAVSSPPHPVYRPAASPEPPRPRTTAAVPAGSPPATYRPSSNFAGSSTPAPAWNPPDGNSTPRRMDSAPVLAPEKTPAKKASAQPLTSPRTHVQATPPLTSPRTQQTLSSPRTQVWLAPTPAVQHRALSPTRSTTITRVFSPPPPPVAMSGPGPASVTTCSGWASPRLSSPAPSPPVPNSTVPGQGLVPHSARERRLVMATEATLAPLGPTATEVPAWVTPRAGSLRLPPRTSNGPAVAAPLGSPRLNSPRAEEPPHLTRSIRMMPSPVRLVEGDWYVSNGSQDVQDRPLSKRWAAAVVSQAGGSNDAEKS